jgi:hypothetical protein
VTDPTAPPQVPYTGLVQLQQTRAAQVFTGVDAAGVAATVIALTPAGQADPAVRRTFEQVVNASVYSGLAGPVQIDAADPTAARPWAATSSAHTGPTGRPGVAALLSTLPEPSPAGAHHPVAGGPGSAGSSTAWNPAVPYAPGPPYQVTTPPRPWSPPTGPWRSSDRLVIAIVLAVVAVVVLGSAAVAVISATRSDPTRLPAAASAAPGAGWTLTSPSAAPPRTWSPSPTLTVPPSEVTRPSLRPVPARRVVGPTFTSADRTFTMAFPDWPFAFRTPITWGCLRGRAAGLPDAIGRVCIDETNPGKRQRVSVMLRPCPTTCTQAQRRAMNDTFFDEPDTARRVGDERTSFVETRRDSEGFYAVAFSRFFGPPGGQPLKWQVGVTIKSPPETALDVQKILNDIYSQTP